MLLLETKDRDAICTFLNGMVVPAPVGSNIMQIVSLLSNLKENEPVPEPAPKTDKDK